MKIIQRNNFLKQRNKKIIQRKKNNKTKKKISDSKIKKKLANNFVSFFCLYVKSQ